MYRGRLSVLSSLRMLSREILNRGKPFQYRVLGDIREDE